MTTHSDSVKIFTVGVELFKKANLPKYSYFSKEDDHMMDFNDELLDKIRSLISKH